MYMNKEENKKIEEILNSLDGHRKATAPDYFYTRLKARMERQEEKGISKSWVLRPAFALWAVILVLLFNTAMLLRVESSERTSPLADTEGFQSLASEYSVNDNFAYDLNQEK